MPLSSQPWELSISDAIRLGLQNSAVARVLSGSDVSAAPTLGIDPDIAEARARAALNDYLLAVRSQADAVAEVNQQIARYNILITRLEEATGTLLDNINVQLANASAPSLSLSPELKKSVTDLRLDEISSQVDAKFGLPALPAPPALPPGPIELPKLPPYSPQPAAIGPESAAPVGPPVFVPTFPSELPGPASTDDPPRVKVPSLP